MYKPSVLMKDKGSASVPTLPTARGYRAPFAY